jgi:hypothetical protein
VHALASWILAFSASGDGYGFPFDVPYLTFYHRVLEVDRMLRAARANWPVKKRGPLGTLQRLKEILDIVVDSEHTAEFRRIVAETERDQKIFEQLRRALRICPPGGTQRRRDEGTSNLLSSSRHRKLLEDLRRSLKRKARGRTSQKACQIVVEHLDKYWDYLFGHVLKKQPEAIVVPRTNNVQESLFRTIKRQCRRLHGRGHICRDIEDMFEASPLVLNLRNASYCETVYGGSDYQRIAERFSAVDPSVPTQLLKNWRKEKLSVRLPRKFERQESLPQRLTRFIGVAFKKLLKQTTNSQIQRNFAAVHNSLYHVEGSSYDKLIAFIWDDARRSEQHDMLIRGLTALSEVVDAIVVPRPGMMRVTDAFSPKQVNE